MKIAWCILLIIYVMMTAQAPARSASCLTHFILPVCFMHVLQEDKHLKAYTGQGRLCQFLIL